MILIGQLIWQLDAIVVRSRGFLQMSRFLGRQDVYKILDRYLYTIYTLWGLQHFLLGVLKFVANLIYPKQGINISFYKKFL